LIHTRPAAIRASVTKAGNRGIDQAWIQRRKCCVIHLHVSHHTGFEILDNDVSLFGHGANQFKAFRLPKVDRQATLVAVNAEVIDADALLKRAPASHHLAVWRWFDFDDIGPEIGQNHCAERAC
jgi:hypothetical protein